MKRPERKNYFPKDFLRGKYEDDLEAYCNYLEQKIKHLNVNSLSSTAQDIGEDLDTRLNEFKELHATFGRQIEASDVPYSEKSGDRQEYIANLYQDVLNGDVTWSDFLKEYHK